MCATLDTVTESNLQTCDNMKKSVRKLTDHKTDNLFFFNVISY